MLEKFITFMLAGRKDDEKGATAVEYGLLVALIAAVIIVTVVDSSASLVNAASTAVATASLSG